MTEPDGKAPAGLGFKKTLATFEFTDTEDGRYTLVPGGDLLDTPQTWVLWVRCMAALAEAENLYPDQLEFVKNVYNQAVSPAEKAVTTQKERPLRIVTVYECSQYSFSKDVFFAQEYQVGGSGTVAATWKAFGPYKWVVERIQKEFGDLVRIKRDPSDAPDVVESWL